MKAEKSSDSELGTQVKRKKRPPGTNLLDEDISVSPHDFPGLLTQTMGGSDRKKFFRQPPKVGNMKSVVQKRLAKVIRVLSSLREVRASLDLKDLISKVNRINEAIQSGKLPPEKMQQASQMLAALTMQMAQIVTQSQQQAA